MDSIVELCGLKPDARVLEVGCGCGRIATALASYISENGSYDGFDVAAPLLNWCRPELQPRLPDFRFQLADEVHAPGHNPSGTKNAAEFSFPYASGSFDLVILSSVLTHMMPEAIENYLRETCSLLGQLGVHQCVSLRRGRSHRSDQRDDRLRLPPQAGPMLDL